MSRAFVKDAEDKADHLPRHAGAGERDHALVTPGVRSIEKRCAMLFAVNFLIFITSMIKLSLQPLRACSHLSAADSNIRRRPLPNKPGVRLKKTALREG
jgi:hypothetical protein